jgi:hypothetical protein
MFRKAGKSINVRNRRKKQAGVETGLAGTAKVAYPRADAGAWRRPSSFAADLFVDRATRSFALVLLEEFLSQANAVWRDLHQFILVNELQRLLQ